MAHVRDRPSLRESVEITTPAGQTYRWADDERRPENVPSGERWSDTMPGGFETHDVTLPRKPGVEYADLERLSTLTRYDAAGGIIWQGRLERAPRVWGDQIAIAPSAVGWQAHLDDDKSVALLGRDIDLSRWRGMSRTRRAAVLGAGYVTADPSVDADTTSGLPALLMAVHGPWAAGIACEAVYDAGPGSLIGSVAWTRTSHSDQASQPSASFAFSAWVDDSDGGGGDESTGDLHVAVADGETTTFTPTAKRRYATFQWRFDAANAVAGEYSSIVRDLAVYGNHGLTLRGAEPSAGFYDADLIGYALDQWCPLLSHTSESLTADLSFIIEHFAFLDPTTVAELVRQATRFRLRDWAVWDGRVFWLHDRGEHGRAWRARVAPARLEETGPQVDRLWNGIIVAYQDKDGSTRTVGPVGSGADTETDDLIDIDPENPANKLGIRRWDTLTMGTGTASQATSVGERFLEQAKLLDSSGRATLVGYVEDDRGVVHPYSHVRAGDTITFVDAADTSERRIVKTEKSRGDRSCSIDIDAPPEGLQELLERLGAELG